jgi:hypothetical protein
MIKSDKARLRAAEQRFRRLPKEVKNDLRRYQRSEAGPIWKEEVSNAPKPNRMSEIMFKTGNTVKTGATITLRASGSGRKLSGGVPARALLGEFEFGGNRQNKYTKYSRTSPRGKRHTVTRRASRQVPHLRKGGYVVIPASKRAIKRLVSLSVQTVTRRIYDSIEGG